MKLNISDTWSFNKKVSDVFDQHVRDSIPLYDEFHKQTLKISEFYLKENSTVYDLGCSTGNFLFGLKNKKKVNLIGIDNSSSMIKIAKKKLNLNKNKNKNIKLLNDDLFKVKFKKDSSLFICILLFPFLDHIKKIDLLKKIYSSLNDKGAVIILNKSRSKYSNFETYLNELYYEFKLEKKITPEDVIKKTKSLRSVHDIDTNDDEIKMYKSIGFKKVEIFFKILNFTGYLVQKC